MVRTASAIVWTGFVFLLTLPSKAAATVESTTRDFLSDILARHGTPDRKLSRDGW